MLVLLASVALLAGTSGSHNLGEQGVTFIVAAEGEYRSVSAEVSWDSSDKVETGDGWQFDGAVDWHTGPLTIGAGLSHREFGEWTKTHGWARAGIENGPLWLLVSIAPRSPNMEAKLEARLRLRCDWLQVEPRAWVGWHSTAQELGGYAYGVAMLVGWRKELSR